MTQHCANSGGQGRISRRGILQLVQCAGESAEIVNQPMARRAADADLGAGVPVRGERHDGRRQALLAEPPQRILVRSRFDGDHRGAMRNETAGIPAPLCCVSSAWPFGICGSLLPSAAQGAVELGHGLQFQHAELRKLKLSLEQAALRVEDLQVAVQAALVAQGRKAHALGRA